MIRKAIASNFNMFMFYVDGSILALYLCSRVTIMRVLHIPDAKPGLGAFGRMWLSNSLAA